MGVRHRCYRPSVAGVVLLLVDFFPSPSIIRTDRYHSQSAASLTVLSIAMKMTNARAKFIGITPTPPLPIMLPPSPH